MVRIMKKTVNGKYFYVDKNGGETTDKFSALKMTDTEAQEYLDALKSRNDGCEYFIV